MLGGAFMNISKEFMKNIFLYVFVFVVSILFSNIKLIGSHFIFVIPWIFCCFLVRKRYGIISFSSSFLFLGIINKWFYIVSSVCLFSVFFIKRILFFSKNNLKNVLGVNCFLLSFLGSVIEFFLENNSHFFLAFIAGVISYWVMVYFYDLFFTIKGVEESFLDSRLSGFLLIIIGVILVSTNINLGIINISLIMLLILGYIAVKIGLDVGCVYSLAVAGLMFLINGISPDLFIFSYTFLSVFFLRNVSKITLVFTYLLSIFFILYYFKWDYLIIVNYVLASIAFLFIPNSLIKSISSFCYGSDSYIKKINDDNKKFNLSIANKIVKMEEVFSLVCEKLEVKDRIKKNDRRLFVEEISVFNYLLKSFSVDVRENHGFDCNYRMEKEFYKYGIDLLDFDFREDLFKNKIIKMDVRCKEKEIKEFIVPLVNKVCGKSFEISKINYNEIFGYYNLSLVSKKRVSFKYGISQRSLDKTNCGDSYLVYENDKIYAFCLSDGMGVGKSAKSYSKQALDLFKKFMDIGFGLKQTLKSLNSLLRDKYNKECYSTLDLFVYDKLEEKFYVCKNGANCSYLIGKEKKVVNGNKLPLGIVEKVDFDIEEINVKKNDLFIMYSDGVGDDCFLGVENIAESNPQKISEIIVDKEKSIKDDKTVFVIKIC